LTEEFVLLLAIERFGVVGDGDEELRLFDVLTVLRAPGSTLRRPWAPDGHHSTTNAVKSLNARFRKAVPPSDPFPNEQAADGREMGKSPESEEPSRRRALTRAFGSPNGIRTRGATLRA